MQQDKQVFEVFELIKEYVPEHNFLIYFTP